MNPLIVYDLSLIQECLNRIAKILDSDGKRDDLMLASYTWQVVILYARCFDTSSKGRQGALGDKATRTLSAEEATLHEGLIDVRNDRFAHAGPDARHRCVLHMFEREGKRWLDPGFEIETPTGMLDDEQVALMQSIVGKLQGIAVEERERSGKALEEYLADPAVSGPICDRLAATKKQATPEATAWAILRGLLTR